MSVINPKQYLGPRTPYMASLQDEESRMFSFFSGEVALIEADRVTLDVSGVGYELFASSFTLSKLEKGKRAKLLAHMAVSQDNIALYGFLSGEERAMFRRLLSVTRVGPKVALAALSTYSAQMLAAAIVREDERMLAKIPGVGKKGAQRVILELKENLAKEQDGVMRFDAPPGGTGGAAAPGMRQEAATALIALGYDSASAMHAVARVPDCDKVETMIMQALKQLAK